ncbi:internal virion protein [Ralstonia phage RSJ5]|uniref:Putative internal virion protein n=1 Tax=Ralstonia phage RSJ5 TaxID=1538364 RepID=A0A077KTK6_9CAUD|nr:internal virion protein [Ralstonia phage RSJ5]BAP34927.1 Putative internal virion protein [Ralstonia phage RSJ5]
MGFIVQLAQAHHSGYNNAKLNEIINSAQRIIDDGNTQATNTVNEANAYAGNVVRAANNAVRAAQSSLSNYQRSAKNQAIQEAGAKKVDAMRTNMLRTADATLRGNMEDRIRSSEQLGALMSQAAAAGMGGGSVDALKSVMDVQDGYVRQVKKDNQQYRTYDQVKALAGVAYDTNMAVDLGQSFANIDYAENTYSPVIQPIRMGDFAPSANEAAMWSMSSSNAWGNAAQTIGSVWGGSGRTTQSDYGSSRGYSYSMNSNGMYTDSAGWGQRSDVGYDYTDGYKSQGMFSSSDSGSGNGGLFGGSKSEYNFSSQGNAGENSEGGMGLF